MRINGEVWQSDNFFLPVHRRSLGYVFQEASLFSHLSVEENLRYATTRARKLERVVSDADAIELLGIGKMLKRMPDQLSGGERQRVAIARALLAAPKLLLMDEPLASLDQESKQEIMPYLEDLRDQLQLAIIYVSHAMEEVSRLADHIVVMDAGGVLVEGGVSETLSRTDFPRTRSPGRWRPSVSQRLPLPKSTRRRCHCGSCSTTTPSNRTPGWSP